MALVYRGVCKVLGVEGPTHVAVWLYGEGGVVDLEFGYTWNGSYVRPNLKDRMDNVLFTYRMPDDMLDTVMYNVDYDNDERIKIADLFRVLDGKPPRGMTCIKWVRILLGMPMNIPYPVTMKELECALYTLGGIRTDG